MAPKRLEQEALSPDALPVDRVVHFVRGAFRNVINPTVGGAFTAAGESIRTGIRGTGEFFHSLFSKKR